MIDLRNWMNRSNARHFVATLGLCLALTPLTPLAAVTSDPAPVTPSAKVTPSVKNDPATVDGQLISFGSVTINDRAALNGSSVPTNSVIAVPCGPGNSAIIKLGAQGLVEVRPGARMRLTFADGQIGGELIDGNVRVRTRSGVRLDMVTPGGRVTSDGRKPTFMPVAARSSAVCSHGQLAGLDDTVPPSSKPVQSDSVGGSSSGLSPLALAALIFGIGVASAITIVALTDSGAQVSPTAP